jgi:hypothetical protein
MLPAILLVTSFYSCTSNKVPDYHTPEISMSWPGLYAGVIPAADGPGIEVQLTLNYDRTFILQYHYIDRGDNIFLYEGTFIWDKTGRIVILDIENISPYYMVAADSLIQLDLQGNIITGLLADNYILKKVLGYNDLSLQNTLSIFLLNDKSDYSFAIPVVTDTALDILYVFRHYIELISPSSILSQKYVL